MPSNASNAFTAALRAVTISASEPESHMRPNRPTEDTCRSLIDDPFSAFVFKTLVDPMDDEGNVHISPEPGLGYDINWDYINSNLVD